MNSRFTTVAALTTATVLSLTAGNSAPTVPTALAGSASGHCSDPNPSYVSLTFAAVVCVKGASRVRQQDGSTELVLRVSVTNKDPNTFGVRSWDFEILDGTGQDVSAEDARLSGRTGVGRCVSQDFSDNGWPVQPGATFTVPGPLCFNLARGEQSRELVWQSDVSVPLRQT